MLTHRQNSQLFSDPALFHSTVDLYAVKSVVSVFAVVFVIRIVVSVFFVDLSFAVMALDGFGCLLYFVYRASALVVVADCLMPVVSL